LQLAGVIRRCCVIRLKKSATCQRVVVRIVSRRRTWARIDRDRGLVEGIEIAHDARPVRDNAV